MRPTSRWTQLLIAVLLLLGASGCEDCSAVGAVCGGPITYEVIVESAPANLGALIVNIQTDETATVSVVTGRAIPTALSGVGSRRAIFLGATALSTLATVRYEVRPAALPVFIVLDAAASQSGGYASIPLSNMRLRVEEMVGAP